MTLFCLCGHVCITVQRPPEFINECNCTLCSKAGARWRYFRSSKVEVGGSTKGFRRTDKEDPNAEIHFCAACGSTTHFVLTESAVSRFGNTLVGVNMGLAEASDLTGVEIRYPDGRAWSGAGSFGSVREPRIID